MLEGPSALALHTCCRLLGRATGAEFNVNLNRGGGCVRALSLGPLPHEVESLENDYWMNPAEGMKSQQEPPPDEYFKRPRIEDDYYERPSSYGNEFYDGPIQNKRYGFERNLQSREHGFVNFKSMKSADEIAQKLHTLGTNLEPGHVEAAFSRLKFLVPSPAQHSLDDITRVCLAQVPMMTLWQVCCMFQACARMNYCKLDLLETLSKVVLSHSHPLPVSSRHISNLFYAIGLYHRRRVGAAKVKFTDKPPAWPSQADLLQTVFTQMRSEDFVLSLSEHDSVSLLYGFSQLLLDDTQDILEAVYDNLNDPVHLAQLTEVQIMTLLSSFVQNYGVLRNPVFCQLGARNDGLIRSVLGELVKFGSLSLFREEELSTITYSLGVLRISDPRVNTVLSMVFDEVVQPQRLQEISERCLVNLIYGMGQQKSLYNFDQSRYFPSLFGEVARTSRLEKYNTQGLCNLIYTMGILRYTSSTMKNLVTELTKPDRLKNTSSQGITISLWGMAKAKYFHFPSIDRFGEEIMKPGRLAGFTCNGVSITTYSLGLMDYREKKLVRALLWEASLPERIGGFGAQDRSNISYAMGRWGKGVVDPQISSKLLKEFCNPENLVRCAQQHMVNLLQCAVALELPSPKVVRDLLDELSKPQRVIYYKPVEFPAILLAVSRWTSLGYKPRADNLWKHAMKPKRLATYTEGALSGIAYSMGLYGIRTTHVLESFIEEVVRPERLPAFNNADLSNILFSVIGCSYHETTELKKVLNELVHPRRQKYLETKQIVTAIAGITKIDNQALSIDLMEPLLDLLKGPAIQEKFDCNSMCVLLANLAFFKPLPSSRLEFSSLVEILTERLKVNQDKLAVTHASRMLITVGQLKMPSHKAMQPIWDFLLMPENLRKVEDAHVAYIFLNIVKLSLPLQVMGEILPRLIEELNRRDYLRMRPAAEILQFIQHLSPLGAAGKEAVTYCAAVLHHPEVRGKLDDAQWARVMDIMYELGCGQ